MDWGLIDVHLAVSRHCSITEIFSLIMAAEGIDLHFVAVVGQYLASGCNVAVLFLTEIAKALPHKAVDSLPGACQLSFSDVTSFSILCNIISKILNTGDTIERIHTFTLSTWNSSIVVRVTNSIPIFEFLVKGMDDMEVCETRLSTTNPKMMTSLNDQQKNL
jgi:hypothetical protein